MAITPPGDIVLDVMRAANPARKRVAAARLLGMAAARAPAPGAGAGKAGPSAWRHALARVAGASVERSDRPGAPVRLGKAPLARMLAADGSIKAGSAGRGAPAAASAPGGGGTGRLRAAHAGLEGLLIANMLEGMLGSGRGALFGGGLAGSYWKSMLAQAIATQVARHGGMGLADAVAGVGGSSATGDHAGGGLRPGKEMGAAT